MWHDLLAALGLLLVLEGIAPFLSPTRLRESLQMIARMSDRSLRIVGATSMALGVLVLYLVR